VGRYPINMLILDLLSSLVASTGLKVASDIIQANSTSHEGGIRDDVVDQYWPILAVIPK
jgi:hypothetical protein